MVAVEKCCLKIEEQDEQKTTPTDLGDSPRPQVEYKRELSTAGPESNVVLIMSGCERLRSRRFER